jgi:hypothetical protein
VQKKSSNFGFLALTFDLNKILTPDLEIFLILVIAKSTTTFVTKTELYLGTGQFKGKGHIFLFISSKMRRVAGLMGYNAAYIT